MMSYLYIWRQKYKFFMEQPKYFNKKKPDDYQTFYWKGRIPHRLVAEAGFEHATSRL